LKLIKNKMRSASVNKSMGHVPTKQNARLFEFSDSKKIRIDEPNCVHSNAAKIKTELNLPEITSPRNRYQDVDMTQVHEAIK
jgi:hypothetical protein